MKPVFSIAVTTYDRFGLLKETISSILNQSFGDFELLIGNDNTERIINARIMGLEDERIKYINHKQNLGFFGNLNSLFDASFGNYFTTLADDDMYMPKFLQTMYTALADLDFPPCAFSSYSQGKTYDERSKEFDGIINVYEGRKFLAKYLRREINLLGSCGVFKHEYYRTIGGMQALGNGFSPYSDNLLAIKAGLLEKVVYINAPLIFYRTHEGSISLVSTDTEAYCTAQEDLLAESIKVFKSQKIKEDYRTNIFLLLRWCLIDYYSVIRRSKSLQLGKFVRYLIFLFRHIRLMKKLD